eukprot:187591_1
MTTFTIDTAVAQQCNVYDINYLGDGWCDLSGGYNSLECEWDKGDCCADSCVNAAYQCGEHEYNCLDPQSEYFSSPSPTMHTISPTVSPTTFLLSNNWTVNNTTLPRIGTLGSMAGGFWNGTFSIFGGFSVQPAYYMEYNIRTNT